MEQLLVSRREAAVSLGVSLRTLDYLVARGELRARTIGRRRLISRVDLEKFAHRGGMNQKKAGNYDTAGD
jgi:excisionase family DNA binding protein